jgi:hypothetical protein
MIPSSQPTAQLIDIAFQCSAAVYEKEPSIPVPEDAENPSSASNVLHRKPTVSSMVLDELEYSKPSIGASRKAIGLWTASLLSFSEGQSSDLPTLVVAIRGTETLLDNMVNFNGAPTDISSWLVRKQLSTKRNCVLIMFRICQKRNLVRDFYSQYLHILDTI